jgi:hypothetical protein
MNLDEMVKDLHPVRLAPSAISASSIWWLASIIFGLMIVSQIHLRANLSEVATQFSFLLSTVLLLLAAAFASYFVFRSGVPGRIYKRWEEMSIKFLIVLAAFPYFFSNAPSLDAEGYRCSLTVAFFALLPAVGFLYFLKNKYAVLQPRRTGYLLGLASGALGAALIALHCPSTESAHLLVWHFLPVLALAVIFSQVAIRVLKF